MSTDLLVLNWTLAIMSGCSFCYYNPKKYESSVSIEKLFIYGIILPIIEELIFRHILLYITQHIELNVILFSGMHLTNYLEHKDIYVSITQFIFSIYPGYYFITLNSLTKGIAIHGFYNIFMLIMLGIFEELIVKKRRKVIYYFF